MSKGWTEERRRKQAETIRRTRPWEKSTGPKTARGKAASRLNALKHGLRSAKGKDFERLLALNRAFVKQVAALYILDSSFRDVSNRLKEKHEKSKRYPPPPPSHRRPK